jgi:hypothetical protein
MIWELYSGRGKRVFSKMSRLAMGPTQPPFNGCQDSFLAVKQLGCEIDHLPSASAKVKNYENYASSLLYAFMACTGTAFSSSFMSH